MSESYEKLQNFYREYIDSINSGDYRANLSRFVHEPVQYNGKPLSLAQYQANIDAAFNHVQGAHFHIDLLTIDVEQQCIAARLAVRGTVAEPFLGLTKIGEAVTIGEHIFYFVRDGKVAEARTIYAPEK